MDIICSILRPMFYGKWVDDIVPVCTPASSVGIHHHYNILFSDILQVFHTLGWPLTAEKLHDFQNVVRYIGFDWNFNLKTVTLPEEKRVKFKNQTESWIASALSIGVNAIDTECLLGSLDHVSAIHEIGHSFLPSSHSFLTSF
jgi:hypothetical protein